MGYMHIDNLYKNQTILLFRECYALEKIHGTSAHIAWNGSDVRFFAGGGSYDAFVALFDRNALLAAFAALGHATVTVYGESYGGKQQRQSWRYGKDPRFVAFDVRIGDTWLAVPKAAAVAATLGLEFVHYRRVSTDIESLNAERDALSEQARRNGVEGDQPREGIVLRPVEEMTLNNGERVIVKHKRDDERETRTPRDVTPERLEVLREANAIADEWVTLVRLQHVLDHLGPRSFSAADTGDVIKAMIEDIVREASGEIEDTKDARRSIGSATGRLFKMYLKESSQCDPIPPTANGDA